MPDLGSCEHCGKQFNYRLTHNGLNDSAYAYCDTCGCTAFFDAYGAKPQDAPIRFFERINREVEPYLEPCSCGGHFSADAGPCCPYCKKQLSATLTSKWIEANAPGTAQGWRWQQNWSDVYSLIIEGRERSNPWKADFA